jgi:hypothetical protein
MMIIDYYDIIRVVRKTLLKKGRRLRNTWGKTLKHSQPNKASPEKRKMRHLTPLFTQHHPTQKIHQTSTR